jgi:hypothetical protein
VGTRQRIPRVPEPASAGEGTPYRPAAFQGCDVGWCPLIPWPIFARFWQMWGFAGTTSLQKRSAFLRVIRGCFVVLRASVVNLVFSQFGNAPSLFANNSCFFPAHFATLLNVGTKIPSRTSYDPCRRYTDG